MPDAPVIIGGRHEDGAFIGASHGWIVNARGEIWHTRDSGANWVLQTKFPGIYLRCVGFADTLRGWAGSIGYGSPTDTVPLYHTIDGGVSWSRVDNFTGPVPDGLCGIWIADSLHIYAVGRFGGPSYLLSSKDGGASWISQDMTDHATALIDCYFFSADSGIIIGQHSVAPDNRALVLFTSDGGITWEPRYVSQRKGVLAWKIAFASPDTGFVSVQAFTDSVTYLKTTDRGLTWSEHTFQSQTAFSAQGIGFISPEHGWIGPHPQKGTLRNIYETRDGGMTWEVRNFGRNINRFRMLSDTLGYAIGETVYKFTPRNVTTSEPEARPALINNIELLPNHPNPFNPYTVISWRLAASSHVTLSVYNLLGEKMATLVSERMSAGVHNRTFNGGNLAGGVYFYQITAGGYSASRKMVLMR